MTQTSGQARLDQFYTDLGEYDLKPLWPIAMELMPLEPRPRTVPWLWRWKTLRELAEPATPATCTPATWSSRRAGPGTTTTPPASGR